MSLQTAVSFTGDEQYKRKCSSDKFQLYHKNKNPESTTFILTLPRAL